MALLQGRNAFTPKHHWAFHLVHSIQRQGNPAFYATWMDESLNKVLKGCCRQTAQSTFETSVLVRMGEVLRGRGAKRGRDA